MTNYRTEFITWYFNEFRLTSMFTDMVATVENSPWHREQNVGAHTDMVVVQYISRAPSEWSHSDLLGAFVCAFHDVGKPIAEETITKDDGTNYRRYTGHEKASTREWENWVAQNWKMLVERFEFTAQDIWATGWVIEHHLPYGVKKPEKVAMLLASAYYTVGVDVYFNVLRADCWGRISDDHDKKKQDVEDFITTMTMKWKNEYQASVARKGLTGSNKPTVYLMIGPSHVGKSTYLRSHFNEDVAVLSWDKLRTEWYDPDYKKAFEMSCEDNDFKNKAQKVYNDMLLTNKVVVVDNTNLSTKSRRNFVVDAKRKGFRVVAVMFPIARDVLLARVGTRAEQPVPDHAVKGHYAALQMPFYGEFDAIQVVTTNL